jgi:hypothetical protein
MRLRHGCLLALLLLQTLMKPQIGRAVFRAHADHGLEFLEDGVAEGRQRREVECFGGLEVAHWERDVCNGHGGRDWGCCFGGWRELVGDEEGGVAVRCG